MSTHPLTQAQSIAESLLGEINWPAGGIVRCPGADLHPKGTTGKRDCKVFVGGDKPPTIFCVHTTSCAAVVSAKNRELRSAIGRAEWEHRRGLDPTLPTRPMITREERARRRQAKRHAEIAKRARAGLPVLLERFAWPLEDIVSSPGAFHDDGETGWRALLSLFAPTDVLWIGDRKDSGRWYHECYFQRAQDWLRLSTRPQGPLMSASCFRADVHQRSRDNVLRTPFLVVESDTLTRDQIGAVFHWLIDQRVPLRAIIDTGGKSLHGWFDQPGAGARRDDLLVALEAMGCDRGPWREPSMSRLPGSMRLNSHSARRQRLVWFCNRGIS